MHISIELISSKIHFVRGKAVMLDQDLAKLYEVETKYLNRQVRRNRERFPEDFMFQLTQAEVLRCQNVTLKKGGRGQHRKIPPGLKGKDVASLRRTSQVLRKPVLDATGASSRLHASFSPNRRDCGRITANN